jgi:hypothetical protein
MKCNECYYCTLNKPLGSEKVGCNQESENYNKIFTKKGIEMSDITIIYPLVALELDKDVHDLW